MRTVDHRTQLDFWLLESVILAGALALASHVGN